MNAGHGTARSSGAPPEPLDGEWISRAATGFEAGIFALSSQCGYLGLVEESETVRCPYCGQSFEVAIDTSVPFQRFTTDCEICCRPFEVIVECEPGEVLSVEVQGE